MKGLTDIPGILVGHASDYDGLTGCTVVLCERGAVAGGEIRGFATGTDEWDVLSPYHVTERIHAVVFAGRQRIRPGSGQSACGAFWSIKASASRRRRLVCLWWSPRFCSIFRIGKSSAHPTREMGEAAAAAATDKAVAEGDIGAGTGATVGKMLGHERRDEDRHRIVHRDSKISGVKVSALAAVNALGDVIDPATAKSSPAPRGAHGEFANGAQIMKNGAGQGLVASEHHAGSRGDKCAVDEGRRQPPGACRATRHGEDDQSGKHDVGRRRDDRVVGRQRESIHRRVRGRRVGSGRGVDPAGSAFGRLRSAACRG